MSRILDTLNAETALADWKGQSSGPQKSEWLTYSCKLVTPLYGGGVRAGEVDRDMPIRVASIRGQLRFWWRVACGGDDPPARLFKREVAIWGGIAEAGPTASQVRVRVLKVGPLQLEAAHQYRLDPEAPGKYKSFPALAPWGEGYSLFSAKGELTRDRSDFVEKPKILAKAGTEFDLAVAQSCLLTSEQRQEVLTALRWWASFGGIGARTRRGLGAVQVTGLQPVTKKEVSDCGGCLALRGPSPDAVGAWQSAVGLLKEFRQGSGLGRNPGAAPNRPGRSRWPEADSVRDLSGCADPRHAVRLVPANAFPRAAFGLPIVFHFKDAPSDRDRRQKGFKPDVFDPEDHVLEPADPSSDDKRDRLASPLILRPYWTEAKWVPAALLLPRWEKHLGLPLKFKGKSYVPPSWPTDVNTCSVLASGVRPLAGRGDNALSAFLQFFQES